MDNMQAIIEGQIRIVEEQYEMLCKKYGRENFGFICKIKFLPESISRLKQMGWHILRIEHNTFGVDCCFGIESNIPIEQVEDVILHYQRIQKEEFEYMIDLSSEAKKILNESGMIVEPTAKRNLYRFRIA